ncbi:MAG: hypothetical protein KGL39_15620 [Patescibacteria group bacterium]|nr:hypothetical protein [Patescibacteria group bacterium]
MSTTLNLTNTATTMAGGVNAYGGQGQMERVAMTGNFTLNDKVTLDLTDNLSGVAYQFGAGNVTGYVFNYVYTFNNKVYGLSGATAFFSAVGEPAVFNDPNASGNSFITMNNFFSTPENLAAMAPYQGRLLFAFRRLVQIWQVDPDPANYALVQTLPNIGTVAPLSVQPVGDMDVYMLADNGVRSVRVRDASNNAIIADIGTPIDAIIQPLLDALDDTQKAAACGIVEPSSNRYWLYMPNPDGSAGTVFVFSYFPSSQIAAWGTYAPTYQTAVTAPAANYTASVVTYTGLTVGKRYAWKPGAHEVSITNGATVLTQEGAFTATATTATVAGTGATVTFTGALSLTTSFVPTKFVVYQGQVWARAGNYLLQYGGATRQQYDNCGAVWTSPYIDSGTPATRKQFESVDVAFQGTWAIGASTDYTTQIYKTVYQNTVSSFLRKAQGWTATGTHYSLQGVESGSGYALFSSAAVHLKQGNEK